MSTPENNVPTNSEVIDELIKDFSDNLGNDNSTNADNLCSVVNSEHEHTSSNGAVPKDFEESDEEESQHTKTDDSFDDFVDEQKLIELENTLSTEDKCNRRQQSIQLKNKGNEEFKLLNYYKAIEIYTEGLRLCPMEYSEGRSILYANRAACKAKLDRKKLAIEDCSKAIEFNNKYVKAYLRRAKLYEDTDKLDESLEDFKKISEMDPGNKEAIEAQIRLPPLISERNEKLKTEMLGKLKDLGNVILRPFGLSTENFQMVQDPNSGGYSINFNQNRKS